MLSLINSRTVDLLLHRYGCYFYVIKCVPNTECICVNHTTHAADPRCKKCLGTGKKIKIHKVFGALRELKDRESNAVGHINSTPKIVYIKGIFRVSKDDIVIDNDEVYHVLSFQHHKGEKGEFAFTRLVCPTIKSPSVYLIRNFKELLNEHKLRKKGK